MDDDACEVYAFGLNVQGQLGIGTEENESSPKVIEGLKGKLITQVSCGFHHSVALTDNGEVYSWGSNEYGQLGRSFRRLVPGIIEIPDNLVITEIACGENHTVAVTNNGQVMSWGSNNFGQLGLGDRESRNRPTQIKDIKSNIIRAACGWNHSLFLSDHGQIFVCGKGTDGQLGLGDHDDRRWPVPLESMNGRPIVQLSAGENHSVALSISGNVYSWGSNKFGQLGVGDENSRLVPSPVYYLQGAHIVHITCGANHTVALSEKGPVYTWGMGFFYQLGHKSNNNEFFPTVIFEFLGNTIKAVSAGQKHTVALKQISLESESTQVVATSWGNNASGQLGLGNFKNMELPTVIEALKGKKITNIVCGIAHTLVIVNGPQSSHSTISFLTLTKIRKFIDNSLDNFSLLERAIANVFSSVGSLNASFLKSDHMDTNENNSGVDIQAVRDSYMKLLSLTSPSVIAVLANSTLKLISELRHVAHNTPEVLRVYPILLENPILLSASKQNLVILEKLCSAYISLPESAKRIILSWFKRYPSELFIRVVDIFEHYLSFATQMSIDSQMVAATLVLDDLYKISEENLIIPYYKFYNVDVSTRVNLVDHYKYWKTSTSMFSFCRYPFLLDPAAKSSLLHIDATEQMQASVHQSIRETAVPYLVLIVRRNFLVEDTLTQLSKIAQESQSHLKKPLKVVFLGEEAVDEGGVRKEFFQLIIRHLFDPAYGMFTYNEESRHYWFNPNSLEVDTLHFSLIGIIIGLAIYNGVILDIRFPFAVYKKLMKQKVGLNDLKDLNPSVGYSLQKLLDYSGDVEDLNLYFEITIDYFGTSKTVDLLKDGNQIPVTNENKNEYVKLYVQYLLESGIKSQFDAFYEGFMLVCASPVLGLFRPEELELTITGNNDEPDFRELEKVTVYEGYTPNHPVVRAFWEIVHSMSIAQKRKFLSFSTGSDRIPIRGLGSIKFFIQRAGPDSERLPTASTCFNVLLLPEYTSKEKLKKKLLAAIENAEGFGLK